MTDVNSELLFVHRLNTEMRNSELILSYTGDFSQEITRKVLSMTERNFDAEGVDIIVRKKVFNVMMESLQNICKHQYNFNESERIPSIFSIGLDNQYYHILSGNIILNDKIDTVVSRINQVNRLTSDELKELYKKTRLSAQISDVGGAGLGFIDMARKSENNMEYEFEKINDTISYFTLLVKISKL